MQLDFNKYCNAFSSFLTIIDIALTLPISTARVESCFSVLTQVLQGQRLSMSFQIKSELVLLSFNKFQTKTIDMILFLQRFQLKSRRLPF